MGVDCHKTLAHYGIKSQPGNTETGQIDHVSVGAHVVSQGKTAACNAVEREAHSAAIPLHTGGHVSLPEPPRSQLSSGYPPETFALRRNA